MKAIINFFCFIFLITLWCPFVYLDLRRPFYPSPSISTLTRRNTSQQLTNTNTRTSGQKTVNDFFKSYPRYDEVSRFLSYLVSTYPSLSSLETIGQSFESRPLQIIRIGSTPIVSPNTRNPPAKPILWIDAGIHAREWIAPITALYIAHRLVNDYQTDPVTKNLVDTFDWRILPIANPDGYEYSHTTVTI